MNWHALSLADTLRQLAVTRSGLDTAAARARRAAHGPNRLPTPLRTLAWKRFLLQFHNVLVYVLLAAGGITALLAHWVDSGAIFGVVVINALIAGLAVLRGAR